MSALARSLTFSSSEEKAHEATATPSTESFTLKGRNGEGHVTFSFTRETQEGRNGENRVVFLKTITKVDGKLILLTPREQQVFLFLASHVGHACTKEMLLEHLYGGWGEPELKIIDVFVCKLRKKLTGTSLEGCIKTIWGRGYTIGEPESALRLVESTVSQMRVAGPFGLTIGVEDLPASDTVRWVAQKKALLVWAVNGGLLSPDEAQQRYPTLSLEEFERWRTLAGIHGAKGLRTTRLQSYR